MTHPFEVGKTYRNRTGEYVVETIDGTTMKVRYVGGGTLVTDVNIQARIWENIQFEKQLARTEERRRQAEEARAARQRPPRPQQARTRPAFSGFGAEDFEVKQRGVAWSSRRDLGRLLAFELSRRTRDSFDYWIVPYQSEIHVARKEQYDTDNRELSPAFFVTASEDGVSYGFHVGKPGGKPKTSWPWITFVRTLAGERRLRDALRTAMEEQQLNLVIYAMEVSYGQVGKVTIQDEGFLWQHEDPGQMITRPMTGEELAEYLQTVAPTKRCDVYLGRQVSLDEALKAGNEIADEIVDMYETLLPLYEASTEV